MVDSSLAGNDADMVEEQPAYRDSKPIAEEAVGSTAAGRVVDAGRGTAGDRAGAGQQH